MTTGSPLLPTRAEARSARRRIASDVVSSGALRLASLGGGALANFLLLGIASRTLSVAQFGVLGIAVNLAFFVQSLDLGVGASYVNAVGHEHHAGRSVGVRTLGRFAVAALACSTSVAVVAGLIGGAGLLASTQPALHATALSAVGVSLLFAVGANINSLPLSHLIGVGRLQRYYLCQLAQPAILLVGTAIAIGTGASTLGYVVVYGLSSLGPGLCAWLCLPRGSFRPPHPGREAENEGDRAPGFSLGNLPLGLRGVSGLLGFVLLPTLAGAGGGPVLAANWALGHRLYISTWSLVGIPYMSSWGRMAHAAGSGSSEAGAIVRRVDRIGLLVGGAGGVLVAAAGPFVIGIVTPAASTYAVPVALLLGSALVLRGSYLGRALYASAVTPSWWIAGASVVAALLTAAGVVALSHAFALAPGVFLLVFTVLDGVLVHRAAARRTTEL